MKVDLDVLQLMDVLYSNNVKPYFVGGLVRDDFLHIPSHDYDITVDTKIIDVIPILRENGYNVIDTSKNFGTIAVILNGRKIDIAEFRGDIYTNNSRKPSVYRVNTIDEDLKRRDFTINSMAYEYPSGKLIDPFNGREDLTENKQLITVRNPDVVFQEDALRIMRAIRFSAKYNLSLDKIRDSLINNRFGLNTISKERIREELMKGFEMPNYIKYAQILTNIGILETIIPEIENYEIITHDSRGHHYSESLKQHMLDTLNRYTGNDAFLRFIAFMHDIGKVNTRKIINEKIQYIGHDVEGSNLIREVLKRLKFTSEETNLGSKIIENHLFFANLYKASNPKKSLAKFFIEQREDINFIRKLIEVAQADQVKDYSGYMYIIEDFYTTPKILSGRDIMNIPDNKRSIALAKARYYQLIGEATTKEKLLHLINTDIKEGNL